MVTFPEFHVPREIPEPQVVENDVLYTVQSTVRLLYSLRLLSIRLKRLYTLWTFMTSLEFKLYDLFYYIKRFFHS